MLEKLVARMLHQMLDLIAADVDGPLSYWNSRFGQSYTVLTCCRTLHSLHTGTARSKHAGMKWALTALEPGRHGVINRACREREGVRHYIKIRQRACASALRETQRFVEYGVGVADSMPEAGN